jgi:hypothetical protein
MKLHKITREPDLLALLTTDETAGIVLSPDEARSAFAALKAYVERGKVSGAVSALHPALTQHWTIGQAVQRGGYDVRPSTIRKACADGEIEGAVLIGKTWSVPAMSYRGWVQRIKTRQR